jgi:hypothetical protein
LSAPAAAGGRELFIYWRLQAADVPAALAALAHWHDTLLADWPALHAQRYRRLDDSGGLVTCMETYALAGGLPAALESRIVAEGADVLTPWCRGPRHVEVFERA